MTGQSTPRGTHLFNRLLGYEPAPHTKDEEWGTVTEVQLYDALVKISIQPVIDYPYMPPDYNETLDISTGKGNWRYVCFNLSITSGDTTRLVAGYHIDRNQPSTIREAIEIVKFSLFAALEARPSYETYLIQHRFKDVIHHRKFYFFAQKCRDFWAVYDPKGQRAAGSLSSDLLDKLRYLGLSE